MLVIRRVIPDVGDFFVNVPFHAPAYGRIELSEVADFHAYFVMLSEAEAPYGQ